jgi:hypothetical protein
MHVEERTEPQPIGHTKASTRNLMLDVAARSKARAAADDRIKGERALELVARGSVGLSLAQHSLQRSNPYRCPGSR